MKCRKNQVTCDSGTDSYVCRFTVTNLTDHYYIRVLTENRTQSRRKGKTCFCVYLYLIYTVYFLFAGVLNGNYVNVGL